MLLFSRLRDFTPPEVASFRPSSRTVTVEISLLEHKRNSSLAGDALPQLTQGRELVMDVTHLPEEVEEEKENE